MFANLKKIFFIVLALFLMVYGSYSTIRSFEKPVQLASISELPSHVGKKVTLPVSFVGSTGYGMKETYFSVIGQTKFYHLAVADDEVLLYYAKESSDKWNASITGYVTTAQYEDEKDELAEHDPSYGEIEYYPFNIATKYDWMFENLLYIALGIGIVVITIIEHLKKQD